MTNKITINTDGGARGNPGPAAIGVVINFDQTDQDQVKKETIKIGKYIGSTTNNVAEYTALIAALEELTKHAHTKNEIECLLDSELVVRQLNGQYKVKDANLKTLWNKVKSLESNFKKITFRHVPRIQNKLADTLVNEVLDSQIF